MMFSSNSLEREDTDIVGAHLNSQRDFFEELKEE